MAQEIKDALKKFKKLRKDLPEFYDYALKDIALRYLSLVIPLTPTGKSMSYDTPEGTVKTAPGTLKWGWLMQEGSQADPTEAEMGAFVERLNTTGNSITIANSAEYAMYVNYGHLQEPGRYVPAIGKRLVKHWVDGIKFKETAENELKPQVKQIYAKSWEEWYREWNKKL